MRVDLFLVRLPGFLMVLSKEALGEEVPLGAWRQTTRDTNGHPADARMAVKPRDVIGKARGTE